MECLTLMAAGVLAAIVLCVIVGLVAYRDGRAVGREEAYRKLDELIEVGAVRWVRPEDNVPGMKWIRIVP